MKTSIIKGHLHPITQFNRLAVKIFQDMGFEVIEGPEIATEHNNFDVLNVPQDHPSRDMQDTFWLKNGKLLRTHTSAMQIPAMINKKPPVKIVIPGRVFRNENADATHAHTFYQMEGFMIAKNVKMSHLIGTLEQFCKKIFGANTQIKVRSSYFPFTEPSIEIALNFNGKWLEMLGAGMIHPVVLENMNIDANKYSGFAFGIGCERFIMVMNNIDDLRLFLSSDLRFNKQF